MKEFKIDSYLYMPLGTNESEIEKIIYSHFSNTNIENIEIREHEIATDFDIIFNAESIEKAEQIFLKAFESYEVDNYNVREF